MLFKQALFRNLDPCKWYDSENLNSYIIIVLNNNKHRNLIDIYLTLK